LSHAQFVEAMAVASTLNTLSVVVGILINNSKLASLRTNVDTLFGLVDAQSDSIDRRFDEMNDMWRSELRGFEERILARIQGLDERWRPT
jgi:hypothetical protein